MTFSRSIGIKVQMELFFVRKAVLFSVVALLCSCSTERTVLDEGKGYREGDLLARFTSNFKEGPNGQASSDQRSEFENKVYGGVDGKKVGKKDFVTSNFDATKEWDGRKSYGTSSFKDSDKQNSWGGSSYETSSAKENGLAYASSDKEYNTKSADISKDPWSGAGRRVDTHENVRVKNTPHIEPAIMSAREYARKTIEDTNAILGRKVSEN